MFVLVKVFFKCPKIENYSLQNSNDVNRIYGQQINYKNGADKLKIKLILKLTDNFG